ncbi:Auxin-binding protein ABP19a [Bienertia sinuspersici]
MFLPVFFFLSILISPTLANTLSDFCVADLSLPNGPSGYPCKDPKRVTADDFVSSALAVPGGNTRNIYKSTINDINNEQFPGLNGMGISMLRGDLEAGGVSPLHTHRVSELLVIEEGTIFAGFIDTNNTAYYKTLNKRDMMIIPPTLLHFFINVGSTPALTYSFFPSDNHGVQIDGFALFGGNLPSKLLNNITLLDHAEVQRLKKLFGGTN